MSYKSILLGLSFLLFSTVVLAQSLTQTKEGNLEIVKNPMIDLLQQNRVIFNNNPIPDEGNSVEKREKGVKSTALGFRVQIYSGPSRNEAYSVQSRFQQQFPDINSYISYTQPNYRVKVGDFRSRSEAQAFMREIKRSFPTVFLFTEQVNVYY